MTTNLSMSDNLEHIITKWHNGVVYEDYFLDSNLMLQGMYYRYHKNGKLWWKSNYIDNERHGEYYSFYDEGYFSGGDRKESPLMVKCSYDHGNLNGYYFYHDRYGCVEETICYKNHKKHGIYIKYNNGKIIKRKWFHNNIEIDLKELGIDITNMSQADHDLLTVLYG